MVVDPHVPLVDSNILIHFFTRDIHFESAKKSLLRGAYINGLVLAEVTNFLQNRFSVQQSLFAAGQIIDHPELFPLLPVEAVLFQKAKKIMRDFSDNALSFTDCVLLAQAEHHKISLITSDKKIMQNYKIAKVVDPLEESDY